MGMLLYPDRIECAMPARLMYSIVMQDVFTFTDKDKGTEEIERLRSLLRFACLVPLEGLKPTIAKLVARQIDSMHTAATDELQHVRADKVAAAIYYFLKEITDTGYLELWEGSPVAEAAALYLPLIEHVFEEEKLDKSAQKQAKKMLSKLQSKGLYKI